MFTQQHQSPTPVTAQTTQKRKSRRLQPQQLRAITPLVLSFLDELRRRRVCRTLTGYGLAVWLVCQCVDVFADLLRMPEWSLQLVLLIGLAGLPVVLVLAWRFDITENGIALTQSQGSSSLEHKENHIRSGHIADLALLGAALLIAAQLGFSAVQSEQLTDSHPNTRIAVFPFDSVESKGSIIAKALQSELQHQLIRSSSITVTAPLEQYRTADTLVLAGFVGSTSGQHRVTLTLTDSRSGAIRWSHAFSASNDQTEVLPVSLASQIINALPANLLNVRHKAEATASAPILHASL